LLGSIAELAASQENADHVVAAESHAQQGEIEGHPRITDLTLPSKYGPITGLDELQVGMTLGDVLRAIEEVEEEVVVRLAGAAEAEDEELDHVGIEVIAVLVGIPPGARRISGIPKCTGKSPVNDLIDIMARRLGFDVIGVRRCAPCHEQGTDAAQTGDTVSPGHFESPTSRWSRYQYFDP
jgi:hypothetical protein